MSHETADEPFQKKLQHEQAQPPPPTPHHLPTPRAFLTDLFGSLPGRTTPATTPYDGRDDGAAAGNRARVAGAAAAAAAPISTTSANPLRGLQGNDRNVFLTLHVLFPNELLPALDLLDRRLVTRFIVGGGDGAQTTATTIPAARRGGDAGCDEGAAAETIGRPAADDDNAGIIGGDRNDDVVDPARPASAPADASSSHDNAEHQQGDAEHTTTNRLPPPLPLYYVHSAQQQHRHQFHHYRHRSRHGHHHGGHGALLGDEDDTVASSAAEPAGAAAGNWYEVRLAAWNCSCPAFAFASFPANLAEPSPSPGPGLMEGSAAGMEEDGWKEEAKGEQEKGGVAAGEEEEGGVGGDGGEGVWERFGFGGLRRGTGETGHVPPVCKHLLACLLVERAPGLFAGSVEEKVVSVEEAAAWAAGWGG
ncbi:uncharacterized protein LTHEOB_7101 [Lasiodiplodia theobromae]|uniref:SWIM-type domain-containing protein n=1 Tax=Lasiodiplodia theobromae TaxID=45133 RepID=A0A5N5DRV7_9PEZI|nr:uncharacterized protein LTHEOB_7101 [Lasiodiplodia theobromae]KAB2579622.1 hypothetical protein DBV05_g1755 [Lasiodiplodia theobromae]KAF4542847.1 hypothetical protein LTHEOB_7101 [Lasiodiplodia theobromae]